MVGDPQLGVGREQPGGWMYQVLPYIEEETVYQIPHDGDKAVTPNQRNLGPEAAGNTDHDLQLPLAPAGQSVWLSFGEPVDAAQFGPAHAGCAG